MGISGFEEGEFCGFCDDFTQQKIQGELGREVECKEYVIGTYGEETEEYKEAKNGFRGKKKRIE